MVDPTEIERRVDRVIANPIPINLEVGGFDLKTMGQVMEFAKLMAISGAAVPKYMRSNVGTCLAICSRALRWGMDPFAVAEKSYMVMNKGEERIAYEAQLVHAVITARAPLKSRLRMEIRGAGDERVCVVSGHFKGEETPHTYTSQTLGIMLKQRPKRRDGDGYGGSPLWDSSPEVQLTYHTVRQWARLHASEVLLGVYTPDELEEDERPAVDVSSKIASLSQRLRDANLKDAPGHRGFHPDHAARETGRNIIEGEARDVNLKDLDNVKEVTNVEDAKRSGDEPRPEGRADAPDSVGVGDHDEGGSVSDGGVADEVRGEPVGENPAQAEQAEIFPPDREPKGKGKQR